MKKLIDADALLEPVEEEYNKLCDAFNDTSVFQAPHAVALYGALMQEAGAFAGMIVNAQAIDAEPVRHGKWNRQTDTRFGELLNDILICSECGIAFPTAHMIRRSYCPNCGARMDKK